MSIEHIAHTIIGFFPSLEEFLDGIEQPLKEVSHMEERFSQRTGARLEDVKVVDREEQVGYVFNGKEYTEDDTQELLEDIGNAVGAQVETVENSYTGDIFGVSIVPNGVKQESDGMHSFTTVANAAHQCEIVGRKLKEHKLNPGPAGVHSSMSVG
jgi:hypothetical protein